MKRILHITPCVGRLSFGIGPIVLNLAAEQQKSGQTVHIWSYNTPSEARALETNYSLYPDTIRSFKVSGPKRLGYSPSLEKAIVKEGKMFDVVHQHGIWTGVSHALNRWRHQTKQPTVIAPQGSLDPYVLKKSWWKKRLALALYESQNLRQAGCVQVLSLQEAKAVREFGLECPLAVIPNGISDRWLFGGHDSQRFRSKYNIPEKTRIMLFLGRITPKKGLPLLLQAMHRCRKLLEGWRLVIAGVDEFNHQQEVQELVEKLGLQTSVMFVGPQFDQDKRDAFAAADLFVLPSHSEGAPVAILEALGAGVPVLTTKASPWEELVTHQCGWWTDISVEAIKDALEDALRRSSTELKEMGQRGKKLVSEKYTWPQIAEQTLVLYEWLIHGGRAPDFVILD